MDPEARVHPLSEDRSLDLVNGMLGEAERAAILRHVASCAECEARLRAAAESHERAHVLAKRHGVAPSATVLAPRFAPEREARARTFRQSLLLAAAFVAIAGGALILSDLNRRHPPTHGDRAALPAPDWSVMTRDFEGTRADDSLRAGIDAYVRGDFSASRRMLEDRPAQGGMEQMRRAYLGDALLRLGDRDRAIELLTSVRLEAVPEPWRLATARALLAALEGAGRRDSADSLRRELSEYGPALETRERAPLRAP